jgi:hypothetical protein
VVQHLPGATGEKRVVERVLGREVDVQRRRADAHPPGHLPDGEAHDSLLGHDLRGDVDDLGDRLLPASLTAVERGGGTGVHVPRMS